MIDDQLSFLGGGSSMPAGFRYQANILASADEALLLERIKELPLRDFEFHGYRGKRRVVSFGWQYDFNERALQKTDDIPEFLLYLRETAAGFAEMAPVELQHVLVTEYQAGAGIGWHKDKAVFGDVIGISLLSSCVFRFRRKAGLKWDRASVTAEPRSAYLLRGPSRSEWEHSIPEVDALRYSITFRNLLEPR